MREEWAGGEGVIYINIHSADIDKLNHLVNEHIHEGWKPLGGIAVVQQLCSGEDYKRDNYSTLYDSGLVYIQSMVKE